jgi:hypothetical protein
MGTLVLASTAPVRLALVAQPIHDVDVMQTNNSSLRHLMAVVHNEEAPRREAANAAPSAEAELLLIYFQNSHHLGAGNTKSDLKSPGIPWTPLKVPLGKTLHLFSLQSIDCTDFQ